MPTPPTAKPKAPNDLRSLVKLAMRYATLTVQNARLSTAERLTLLLSGIAFWFLALIFFTIAVVFITLAVGHSLDGTLPMQWVDLIIAGIYLLILLVVWALRRPLLLNPICRFVTRLVIQDPDASKTHQPKS